MIVKFTWHYFYVVLQSSFLELPVYYFGFRNFVAPYATRSLRESERVLIFICLVIALNSVTHPILFFGFMNMKMTYLENVLFAQAFAIAAEALFMRWFFEVSLKRSTLVSLVANLSSWQLAPILTYKIFG